MTEIDIYLNRALDGVPLVIYWLAIALFIISVVFIFFTQRSNSARLLPPGCKKSQKAQKIARVLLLEFLILIYCSAVVFREPREVSPANLQPLWSYFNYAENSYLKEMAAINILNVTMFLPVGFLMKLGFPQITWENAMLVGGSFSMAIEVSQFAFDKGFCEIDDLIHNVVGCIIGYGIATVFRLVSSKMRPCAERAIKHLLLQR